VLGQLPGLAAAVARIRSQRERWVSPNRLFAVDFLPHLAGRRQHGQEGDAGDGRLTVGIRFDQPGLGERTLNGELKGFDVEVAKYVANELGVSPDRIVWKEAQPANRETLLTGGKVDMVVAAYTISDERRKLVDFAGPYFTLGQDLLIRQDDHSIVGPESLNGKRLCTVVNTTSAQAVKDKFAHEVTLVEYPPVPGLHHRAAGRSRRRRHHRRRHPGRLRRAES
jgi:ABC-type amino acid transport substrate-binding protein